MSHPQFRSIRMLILRHAWLNLLDKHMTTGRINQITAIVQVEARLPPDIETLLLLHVRGRSAVHLAARPAPLQERRRLAFSKVHNQKRNR